eukprot:scaffold37_cov159-Amphora_coffeaeformis.AAC.2
MAQQGRPPRFHTRMAKQQFLFGSFSDHVRIGSNVTFSIPHPPPKGKHTGNTKSQRTHNPDPHGIQQGLGQVGKAGGTKGSCTGRVVPGNVSLSGRRVMAGGNPFVTRTLSNNTCSMGYSAFPMRTPVDMTGL